MAIVTLPSDTRINAVGKQQLVQYGTTVAPGQPLYLDAADGKYKLCDANNTAAIAAIVAIAITPGVADEYGIICTSGTVTYTGTTFVIGHTYFVSQTAGSIIPHADLATNDYVSRIGTASTASKLVLSIEATGIQHA